MYSFILRFEKFYLCENIFLKLFIVHHVWLLLSPHEERLFLSKPVVQFSFAYGASKDLLYICSFNLKLKIKICLCVRDYGPFSPQCFNALPT